MKKEKCPCKGCDNEATVEFGPLKLCQDCFVKVAYDMQPLVLEG